MDPFTAAALLMLVASGVSAHPTPDCPSVIVPVDRLACYDRVIPPHLTSGERLVASFQGSGFQQTRPFTVGGPWELRWTGRVSIEVRTDTRTLDSFGNYSGGSAYEPKGGVFFLGLSGPSTNTWRVDVVELPAK